MNKPLTILMVEDSESDAALVVRELNCAGYEPCVERVETAEQFVGALDSRPWDLILCDYSLPGFNGLAALQHFKDRGIDTPFIFVSGAMSEDTAVEAMKSGAHDYVMKSNLKRLVPAIERELREAAEREEKRKLHAETLRIRLESRKKDALFRSLIEHSSDGISLVDEHGTDFYDSPSAERILGYDPRTSQDGNIFSLIHPDDRDRLVAVFHELTGKSGAIHFDEVRVQHADGSWRWIEAVSHNLLHDQNVRAIVVNYRDITERKNAEEQLRRSQDQLRALAANLQTAREEERKTIARDFHDQIGQSLTAMKMALVVLDRKITAGEKKPSREEISREIHGLQAEIDHATQSIRQTMSELRPELLDQLGLVAALSWESERFAKRCRIPCQFESNIGDLRLDPDRSIALFRIFQEALTNVARHAHAHHVHADLRMEGEDCIMTIADDGVGISDDATSKFGSFGLLGIRERTHLLNGTFAIEGKKGKGTRLTVCVPLPVHPYVQETPVP